MSHTSGLLVVTIEMPPEEWCNDPVELVSVEGDTKSPRDGVLSDVEWFKEEWSCVGTHLLYDEAEPPAYGQRHTFRGRLVSSRDYWGEVDVWWKEEDKC